MNPATTISGAFPFSVFPVGRALFLALALMALLPAAARSQNQNASPVNDAAPVAVLPPPLEETVAPKQAGAFSSIAPPVPSGTVGGAWSWLGPAPTFSAQLTVPPSNQVSGAVQAIAANPTNADILYAGAVNGGVWRTTNATATTPQWTPLTDSLASLSIGSLEFDATDPARQTLVAGSGRTSSYGALGGARIGVLRTTDGGSNWSVLGTSTFGNENLTSVAARSNILMAASDSTWGGGNGSGLFRSTNTGASFTLVSGTSGLSAGPVSDLVADPINLNRFFAAVKTVGIFRSDNTGATWTNVTGTISGITASTTKIEMAVHNNGTTTAVYVGVLNASTLSSVWRSGDLGATWTQMDTPATGGQGDVHFSIVADPTNSFLVYMGGQAGHFRGNAALPLGSQFTSINGSGGGNTTPHADSREMVFDANGNILESDDGGVYRRVNPQSSSGVWVSVVGTLGVIEAHNVAYDSVAHVAMIGTQDNGSHIMQTSNSSVWLWISGGDGADVAIDDSSTPAQSVRYGSSQNLGGFYRKTYNAANGLVSTVSPTLTLLNGSPAITPQFVTPVELNKLDATRMIIGGGNFAYESTNRGDSVQALTNGGASVNGTFSSMPIAYGGRLAGVPNTNILYYGSGSSVKIRTTAGGAVASTATAFPGGTVQDVVMNTNDWRQIFATGSSAVYQSPDAGTNWVNITGNLTGVGSLRTLEFFALGGADAVAIGTDQGVFTCYLSDLGNWSRLGTGLPLAAIVNDMKYSVADHVLVMSTMGRGVWLFDSQSLSNAVITSATTQVLSESCIASNGVVDPGETVAVAFALQNTGNGDTTNLVATLLATNGVLFPSGPQTYGALVAGGGTGTNSFSFQADGPCGGTVTATFSLTDGAKSLGTVAFPLTLGISNSCCLDPASVDVGLTIAAAPNPVLVGSNLTITITVSNTGPAIATGVVVTNTLPAGATFVSATPSQGSSVNSATNLVSSLGSLAASATATIAVVVTPTAAGTLTVTGRVASAQFDYNSFNNTATRAATAFLPSLSINDASVTEGNSGTTNAVFTVTLSPAYGQTVTVTYLTAGSTATSGADFTGSTNVLTFAPGVTNQTVTVPVIGDLLNEANEIFFVNLSNAVNAVIADGQGIGTIINDDPLPSIVLTNASIIEGNLGTNNVSLNVRLSAPSGQTVTVNYATSNGTATAGVDYIGRATNATFSVGTTNVTLTFTVIADVLAESNETFFVNFTTPTNATLSGTQSIITIINDDGFPNELDHFSFSSIGSVQTAFVPFPVTVTARDFSNNIVSNFFGPALLSGSTGSGEIYRADFESGLQGYTIDNTFGTGAGLWHLSTGRGNDAGHSSTHSLYYGTNETASGGGSYDTGNNEGVVTSPQISLVGAIAPVRLTFNYLLQTEGLSTYDFAYVDISTNNGASYVNIANANTAGPLTNNTGLLWRNANIDISAYAGQQVRLRFHFDTVDGAVNGFEGWYLDDIVISATPVPVSISPSVTGDFTNGVWAGLLTVKQNAASMVVRAGDAGGHTNSSGAFAVAGATVVSVTDASVLEGNSGLVPMMFNVSLSQTNASPVTVDFATADGTAVAGSDYVATSGTVVFAPGEVSKNVTVNVIGDTASELDETFTVTLSNPAGSLVLGDVTATGTILNDDPFLALSDSPRNDFPLANGTVNAVVERNGVVYFGGSFTEVGVADSGKLVPFFLSNGFPASTEAQVRVGILTNGVPAEPSEEEEEGLTPFLVGGWPRVDQTVNVVIGDNAGGWYVGGSFVSVGGLPRSRLVHIMPDLSIDTMFFADCNGAVNALLLDGTNLFVGGGFTSVTNAGTSYTRTRFAVLDPDTGAPRSLPSDPAFNNTVLAFALTNDVLYLGGSFTNVTTSTTTNARSRLAAIDLTTGFPTAFVADADNTVNALVLGTSTLYVGGTFTTVAIPGISTNSRPRFAEVDQTSGALTSWSPIFNSTVSALYADGNTLYVGGAFTAFTNNSTGFARSNLVALDVTTGNATAWNPAPNGSVQTIAPAGGQLIIGGNFTSVGTVPDLRRVAAVDATTGAVITSFGPDLGSTVNSVAVQNGIVYVGGTFTFFKGALRNRLAAVNAATGDLLPWDPNANNTVQTLASSGSNIYAGGLFTTLGGLTRNRLAAIDPTNATPVTLFSNSFNGTVRALAVGSNYLYVGGDFTNVVVGAVTYSNIYGVAAVDLTNGAPNTNFVPNPLPLTSGGVNVQSLALDSTNLYLGGQFTNVSGLLRQRVTRVNATSGTIDPVWSPQLSSNALALVVSGTNLYVGGQFTGVTNTTGAAATRNRIAAISTQTGDVTAWNPNANNNVFALALRDTNVIAGGQFTTIAGQTRNRLAELTTNAVVAVRPWNPSIGSDVNAIVPVRQRVYVGGAFTTIGTQSRQGFAAFDPNFTPSLSTSDTGATFTEHDPDVQVAPNLVITDLNNVTVTSASAVIISNYVNGEDFLACAPSAGITVMYNGVIGALTLTGTASLAAYQSALQSLVYLNPSSNPSAATRTVRFTVSDGVVTSAPLDVQLTVVPVNDPPTISAIASLTTVENQLSPVAQFVVSDPESASSNLFLAAIPGNPILVPSTNVFFGGSGSNRTVSILPGLNQSGSNIVTINVSDGTNFSGTSLIVIVLKDTDHDGIPDVYENAHGMNPNDATDAAKDFDGDGLTNLQEYLAGTDPNDPYNYLRIISVTPAGADVQISFTSITGKNYRVERTDNLNPVGWTLVADNVPGTGANVTVNDPGATSQPRRSYRVQLLP